MLFRKRIELVLNTLAVLAILVGGSWFYTTFLVPVWGLFANYGERSENIVLTMFAVLLFTLLGAPGLLLVVFGSRLIIKKTSQNIKGIVGSFCVFAAFLLASRFHEFTGSPRGLAIVWLAVAILCVVPVYMLATRCLLDTDELPPHNN